jgi:tRNA1Val (adenine37-N6)-methyltransferase
MTFGPEALSRDAFLGGRLHLFQPLRGYRAATDPVLLAAFVQARPGERALDLGCGAGAAGLCLARRVPGLEVHGLEAQPDYADLARRNAAANGLDMEIHDGDICRPPASLRALSFDHVLANPPFHARGSATGAADPGRDRANREGEAGLADWIAAGLRRLRPGGRLALIHRTERLAEMLAALGSGAGGIEILPLVPRGSRPASRLLLRAHKSSRAPLTLYSPLTIHAGSSHAGDGDDYTEEASKILRGLSALLPDARLGGKSAQNST